MEKTREEGREVYLSHPNQTKAIASARWKSDKVDAPMLAKLLKGDLPPADHRSSSELLGGVDSSGSQTLDDYEDSCKCATIPKSS